MKAKNIHEFKPGYFRQVPEASCLPGRVHKLLTVRVKELAKHEPQATKTCSF